MKKRYIKHFVALALFTWCFGILILDDTELSMRYFNILAFIGLTSLVVAWNFLLQEKETEK